MQNNENKQIFVPVNWVLHGMASLLQGIPFFFVIQHCPPFPSSELFAPTLVHIFTHEHSSTNINVL